VFDAVFTSEGIEVLLTPPHAPRANAYAKRRVRTVRRECPDRVLTYSTRHLLTVLREYLAHYNGHRAHQGRGQRPPDRDALPAPVADLAVVRIRRRKVAHGLINEYEQVAQPKPNSRTAHPSVRGVAAGTPDDPTDIGTAGVRGQQPGVMSFHLPSRYHRWGRNAYGDRSR
jgi:hypothetical protein